MTPGPLRNYSISFSTSFSSVTASLDHTAQLDAYAAQNSFNLLSDVLLNRISIVGRRCIEVCLQHQSKVITGTNKERSADDHVSERLHFSLEGGVQLTQQQLSGA